MAGLQILKRTRQVPDRLVQARKGLPVADIGDCMAHMTAAGPRLRPMHRSGHLAGPALTVEGPGEINRPVAIDGMVIHPGDLVVGDADGLLCVPFEQAEAVLAATRGKMAAEQQMLADIAAGRLDTAWIDATLRRIGCNTEPL